MSAMWSVQARWLFPVEAPPIREGVLTLCGDKILAVEPPGLRSTDCHLGNVAILPGLVNAHTHLDLGALRGKLSPSSDFTQWLRGVVHYRRNSSPEEWKQAIQGGIEECLQAGTTMVGDISVGGHSLPLLAASPLRRIVFYELIGLTKQRARQTWKEAQEWIRQYQFDAGLPVGLSPHAPYSVRKSLFRRTAHCGAPQAIHLAETRLEAELLATKTGPLRKFLEELDAWDADGLAENLDWLVRLPRGHASALFIHGNYVDRQLIEALKGRTVVYCPRTHTAFGHPPHPFPELLAAGVNVALGTDSLASNPDLSILEEMRHVWRRRSGVISGDVLLRMGTWNGARVLDPRAGSLKPGKSADWISVALPNCEPPDPHELLFDSSLPLRDVVISGQWHVRDGNSA
jgi:cytosine/adenosine deaminase-related metal-dependent hydrolase